jgi:predicted TIM-barrel fold metal-dependent hydrolase
MINGDFVVSGDGHLLEPIDLFRTRLPKHLRDRAVWEEDFEVEPLVEGGARIFRRLHTPGFEGWTISRYRQTGGRTPEGDPEMILEDMDLDGVDAQVLHPNLSLFGLYSDDHELSMAHARVYTDYVIERFSPYFSRLAPTAPIPISDVDDAVAQIEKIASSRFRAILLPATPPKPYYSPDFDPIWAAAQANGVHAFFHTQTGGVKVNDPASSTLKVMMETAAQVNQPVTQKSAAKRMVTQAVYAGFVPGKLMSELIGGGVAERFPDLHFSLIEFNAHWLASLVGGMDKCWVTGIGQDPDWWIGAWDDRRPPDDQPNMAQLFQLNEKWPYPLLPSEYVKRQFHVQFQDDPVALACRDITGVSSLVWGNDYPHAEGTFRGSRELITKLFAGVPAEDRAAILGGTLGRLLQFQAPHRESASGSITLP